MGRQGKSKAGAFSGCALDPDGSIVQFEDAPGNGQAESGISSFAVLSLIPVIKTVKNKRQIFRGDAAAGVADAHGDVAVLRAECQPDRPAGGGVAHGVFEKVFDDPLNHGNVGVDKSQALVGLDLNGNLFFTGGQIEFLYHVLRQLADVKRLTAGPGLMRIQFGKFEKRIDQFSEPLAVPDGHFKVLLATSSRRDMSAFCNFSICKLMRSTS
jgi:hypothetical protein